jgi:hypothetical protein
LICGALTWLRDHKRYILEHGEANENDNGLVLVGRLCVLMVVGNEPEWVLEFERQERRAGTEVRKREMEERIARVREKERREKVAVKKGLDRVTKKRVSPGDVVGIDGRKRCRRRMRRRSSFSENIIPMTKLRNPWTPEISSEAEILLPRY